MFIEGQITQFRFDLQVFLPPIYIIRRKLIYCPLPIFFSQKNYTYPRQLDDLLQPQMRVNLE